MRKLIIVFAVFALAVMLLTMFTVPATARPPTTMLSMVASYQASSGLLVVSRGITAVPMTMATARNAPEILTPTAMAVNDRTSLSLLALTEVLTQEALNANRLNYGSGLPNALAYRLYGSDLPGALACGSIAPTLTNSFNIQIRSISPLPMCFAPVAFNDAIAITQIGPRQEQADYSNDLICIAAITRIEDAFIVTEKRIILRL